LSNTVSEFSSPPTPSCLYSPDETASFCLDNDASVILNIDQEGSNLTGAYQTIGDNATWSYVPGASGNWASPPNNIADALDDLAATVGGLANGCLYSASTNSSVCVTDSAVTTTINYSTEMVLNSNGSLQVGSSSSASGTNSIAFGSDSVAFDKNELAHGVVQFTNPGDAQNTRHVIRQTQTGAGTFAIEHHETGGVITIPPSTAFIATIQLIGVDTTTNDTYGLRQSVRGYNTSGNSLSILNIEGSNTGQGTLAASKVAVYYNSSGTTSSRSRFTVNVTTSSGSLGSDVTRWVMLVDMCHVGTL
jgi:hypothetical protein